MYMGLYAGVLPHVHVISLAVHARVATSVHGQPPCEGACSLTFTQVVAQSVCMITRVHGQSRRVSSPL